MRPSDRHPRERRRGFALPMVILVMFVLVGAIAAGFSMLSSERSSDDSAMQAQSAAALAETGLQQGLRNRLALGLPAVPPAAGDSVRVWSVDSAGSSVDTTGYADVVTRLMRPGVIASGIPALYYVRSRGVRTRAAFPGGGNAVSMAGAFAAFTAMRMNVQASVTSINGVRKAGGSGLISGVDQCTGDTIAAVAVPASPGYAQTGGGRDPLVGSPKVDTIGATSTDAATGIPFDWSDIVYRGAIQATITIPNGGNPSSYFPSGSAWDAYPTIIVRNGPTGGTPISLGPGHSGKGLLIVFGDLITNGNFTWDGVIIVGSQLTMKGTEDVRGAVATGLNAKLGLLVGESDLGTDELAGNTKLRYNSCLVTSSMTALGSLRAYQNTWANNFPTY